MLYDQLCAVQACEAEESELREKDTWSRIKRAAILHREAERVVLVILVHVCTHACAHARTHACTRISKRTHFYTDEKYVA